jgi:ATP-dependent Zn protease
MHHLLYIDPGSGSYLIQAIVAGALGVVFFFKNIKNHIKAFFFRKKKEE